ncbi:MAG: YggS family pyridoxal phosphate-dependent enzyme [Caldithrix sp.]|nr:YggS family pyridoxal phosphate-dependent enzyme [Caldithrix sp.]
MNFTDNVKRVQERIVKACQRSGRSEKDIELLAVCKTFSTDVIQDVYDQTGLRLFGESRAQDLRVKHKQLPQDIHWHFIGHLQTNKIKFVAPIAELTHSIDSMHLAQSISEYCLKHEIKVEGLLEVNTSGEKSKFGIQPEETVDRFLEIDGLSNIELKGLMTIAPFTEDQQIVRNAFRQLYKKREALAQHVEPSKISVMSMGMTQDFELAIEEGSTIVRIGTAIFGSRGR